MTVDFSHFTLACVRESVSDLGYGHDDISCNILILVLYNLK